MLTKVLFILSKYFAFLRFVLKRKDATLLVNGKPYYIPNPNGAGILMKTWMFSQSISTILASIDLYVDVGAHFGDNILCVKYINPAAAILAFEPSPISATYLKKNISRYSDVSLHEVALGATDSRQEIHLDTQHLDTASLNEHATYLKLNSKRPIEQATIQVKPLDSFVKHLHGKKKVYLKIDVETFEEEVLKGGESFLKQIKYLEIEWSQTKQKPLSKCFSYIHSPFRVLSCTIQMHAHVKDVHLVNMLLELI
jgi:FkbM family methyltransferase